MGGSMPLPRLENQIPVKVLLPKTPTDRGEAPVHSRSSLCYSCGCLSIFLALPYVLKTPSLRLSSSLGSHPAHSSELSVRVIQRSVPREEFLRSVPAGQARRRQASGVFQQRSLSRLLPGHGTTCTILFWNGKRTSVL